MAVHDSTRSRRRVAWRYTARRVILSGGRPAEICPRRLAQRHVACVIPSPCAKSKTLKQAISMLFMDGAYQSVTCFKVRAHQNSLSAFKIRADFA